jgi:signal-transduction protein with cAMP-binding, CBS, and nucleotidyltransferase domain
MSLLENQPRSASVIAATETTVLRINKENFLKMIAEQPALALNIMTVLSGRIRYLNNEVKNREKTIRTIKLNRHNSGRPVRLEALKTRESQGRFIAKWKAMMKCYFRRSIKNCLIIGELLLAKGEEEEANKYFQAAFKDGGKDAYNHQALKRMNSLKKI